MDALVALFLESAGSELFRKELVALIDSKNCPVWIMSSSPSCIVEPIAKKLGVDLVTASYYALDASGCYCHVERVVDGHQKEQELTAYLQQTGLTPASVTAYSDSILDLALLHAVGRAVAVCPDRRLKRIAQKRSWQVLEV